MECVVVMVALALKACVAQQIFTFPVGDFSLFVQRNDSTGGLAPMMADRGSRQAPLVIRGLSLQRFQISPVDSNNVSATAAELPTPVGRAVRVFRGVPYAAISQTFAEPVFSNLTSFMMTQSGGNAVNGLSPPIVLDATVQKEFCLVTNSLDCLHFNIYAPQMEEEVVNASVLGEFFSG